MRMVENKIWVDHCNASRRLVNPGKAFFLKLAAAVFRDVSEGSDNDATLLV